MKDKILVQKACPNCKRMRSGCADPSQQVIVLRCTRCGISTASPVVPNSTGKKFLELLEKDLNDSPDVEGLRDVIFRILEYFSDDYYKEDGTPQKEHLSRDEFLRLLLENYTL